MPLRSDCLQYFPIFSTKWLFPKYDKIHWVLKTCFIASSGGSRGGTWGPYPAHLIFRPDWGLKDRKKFLENPTHPLDPFVLICHNKLQETKYPSNKLSFKLETPILMLTQYYCKNEKVILLSFTLIIIPHFFLLILDRIVFLYCKLLKTESLDNALLELWLA